MSIRRLLHWKTLIVGGVFAALTVAACHVGVKVVAGPHCHVKIDGLPKMKAGLVLGCAPTVQGRPNLFFTKRIQAAALLMKSGKVQVLIVSGDNSNPQYDEATAMKDALVKAGVPEKRIYLDYAGFRTLDSVVRAKEVFGQVAFIVVSQRFHNERAVFLARRVGINAVGYDAGDVGGRGGLLTHLREYLARVQAVLDVEVLGTEPKFLGAPVLIAGR